MNEQANIRPWLTIPHLPIRSGAFMAVLLGLITHGWFGSTVSYSVLAVAGVALGLSAALTGKLRSRWGVGLGVLLSIVGSIALWEWSWHGISRDWVVLTPFGALVLTHLCLWLGADGRAIMPGSRADWRRTLSEANMTKDAATASRQRWRWIGLWMLVALQATWLVIHLGYTRLPCSWLDPIRVAAGCQGALTSFAEGEEIEALTRTSQGVLVVTSKDKTVRVQRVDDGALLTTITLPRSPRIADITVSADGDLMLTDVPHDQIDVWSVADGTRLQAVSDTMKRFRGRASVLAFAPDGTMFATTTTYEKGVQLWRVSDGTLLRTLPVELVDAAAYSLVDDAAFSPDGALLAIAGISTIEIWRVNDGTLLRTLDLEMSADDQLSFSPDGRFLAIGGGRYDRDAPGQDNHQPQVIQVWRVADGTHLQSFSVAYDPTNPFPTVDALAFSPDSTAIAAAISGEPIRTWRISDGALLRAIEHTSSVGPLAFSDDGQTLLIGGYDELYRWAAR